jgi:hypothetical protein
MIVKGISKALPPGFDPAEMAPLAVVPGAAETLPICKLVMMFKSPFLISLSVEGGGWVYP